MATNPHRLFIREKLGGDEAAAEALSRSPGAIRMWAYRKAIPRTVWPEIIDKFDGVTLEDLRALEQAA
jgi:hypothetical protein